MNSSQKKAVFTFLIIVFVALVLSRTYYVYSKLHEPNVASSYASLTDAAFIKVTADPKGKVLARGDINQDGYEDALVQELHCGASCSVSLDVVLNNKNIDAQLAVSGGFEPGFKSSSAAKSSLTYVSIKEGVISLTGYGLDCGGDSGLDSDICTEENWHKIKTLQFTLNSTNGGSKYYLKRLDSTVELMSLNLYIQDKEAAKTSDCRVTKKIIVQVPKTPAVADASLKILFEEELAQYGYYRSVSISNGIAKVMLGSGMTAQGTPISGLSSCEKGHLLAVLKDTLTQYKTIQSVEVYSPEGKIEF